MTYRGSPVAHRGRIGIGDVDALVGGNHHGLGNGGQIPVFGHRHSSRNRDKAVHDAENSELHFASDVEHHGVDD